jgi:putative NIF3 family GTP cyclohydrolase 1 type 2
LSRLAAIARGLSLRDPSVRDEAPQERIDEIVVHHGLSVKKAGLFLERVSVPRAGQERRQKH